MGRGEGDGLGVDVGPSATAVRVEVGLAGIAVAGVHEAECRSTALMANERKSRWLLTRRDA